MITRLVFLSLLLTGCGPLATVVPATIVPTPMFTANCIAGAYDEQIVSSNQARSYRLHIPPTYEPGKPTPLLFGFHGGGGSADEFESYSGFSNLADREGFIAVYPQGLGEFANWNTSPDAGNQDVQFVSDLIDDLKIRCNIDAERIYAVGHSRGGGMVNRLACNLSDQIAAIGPVSGTYEGNEHCSPTRAVSIVAVHGVDDPIVPYNGFPYNKDGPPQVYSNIGTPIPQWASTWATRNDCNAKSSIIFEKDPVSGQSWEECRNGAAVVLYTIKDWGHNWLRNEDAAEFDTAQVMWDFFVLHPYK